MHQCLCDLYYIEVPLSHKTLNYLQWKDEQGDERTFRFVYKVSEQWRKFGILLDLNTGKLDKWFNTSEGIDITCWHWVMDSFLEGKGWNYYPATWDGLYCLLEDTLCSDSDVVKDFKKAVESKQYLA